MLASIIRDSLVASSVKFADEVTQINSNYLQLVVDRKDEMMDLGHRLTCNEDCVNFDLENAANVLTGRPMFKVGLVDEEYVCFITY